MGQPFTKLGARIAPLHQSERGIAGRCVHSMAGVACVLHIRVR